MFNPVLADKLQIILHTHFVITRVPIVHAFYLFARVLDTFKTKDSGCIAFETTINSGTLFEQI